MSSYLPRLVGAHCFRPYQRWCYLCHFPHVGQSTKRFLFLSLGELRHCRPLSDFSSQVTSSHRTISASIDRANIAKHCQTMMIIASPQLI
jgi:hypothetical protein